jgi:hypothetical protein
MLGIVVDSWPLTIERWRQLVTEREVSQLATPQPAEKGVRKTARELGVSESLPF